MSELAIVHLGVSVLRQRAAEVEVVDDEVRDLAASMFRTMYEGNGQGLAAPQVGISRRLAVVDVPPRGPPTYVLVNPRVTWASEETTREIEGCLSIPGMWETVERPARVVVETLDAEGRALRLEAEGDLARCLQHEIDHLDGVLYIDRLSPLIRRMLMDRYQKKLRAAKRQRSF
jgi:peptide deformylase